MTRFALLLIVFLPCFAWAEKSHIEYAAGNYMARNLDAKPSEQLKLLFRTLDELVLDYGTNEKITFFVNDINSTAAALATRYLRRHAEEKGYTNVEVVSLPGDVHSMRWIPRTDTAHLKNPDLPVMKSPRTPATLQRLADHSVKGLQLTTYMFGEWDKIKGALTFKNQGPGDLYIYPDGLVSREATERYLIAPKSVQGARAWKVQLSRLFAKASTCWLVFSSP